MGHDAFNTRGGEFGFSIEFADGGRMTERAGTWDEVPRDRPIKSVGLAHLGVGVDYVRLAGFREFFFSNEAVDAKGGSVDLGEGGEQREEITIRTAQHAGKILGGVNSDGVVVEVALVFTHMGPKRVKDKEPYRREECRFAEAAFRPGA